MKTIIITILATVCLHATGTKLVSTTKEEYLKELNELRRDAAKKYQIPNMYKLFWDHKLAEKGLIDDSSGIWETRRQTWRDSEPFIKVRDLDSDLAIDNRTVLVNDFNGQNFMSELEVLTPGQQKIGCIEWFRNYTYSDDFSVTYLTYCDLGPEGTGTSWNVSSGEPGSVCDQGFENDDGLCSPVVEPEPTAHVTGAKLILTTKKEYLKDINELRRNAAKKYKIPNMYELFWDNALAEEGLVDDFSGHLETKRQVWRDSDPFIKVRDLDSDLAINNRTVLIDEFNSQIFMSELEVLTPEQQRIGCIPWYLYFQYNDGLGVYYYTYCFLKPEGTGDSWNMTQGEPGSVCALGFENNDGLCSPAPPTTPTPETTTSEPASTTSEPELTTPEPETTTAPLEPTTAEPPQATTELKMTTPEHKTPPKSKIIGRQTTAPPKPLDVESESHSEPAQDSTLPTDGASYGQIGMTLILVIFMLF
ncbi:unnamed protein product [Caenorhabditis nigoni]